MTSCPEDAIGVDVGSAGPGHARGRGEQGSRVDMSVQAPLGPEGQLAQPMA